MQSTRWLSLFLVILLLCTGCAGRSSVTSTDVTPTAVTSVASSVSSVVSVDSQVSQTQSSQPESTLSSSAPASSVTGGASSTATSSSASSAAASTVETLVKSVNKTEIVSYTTRPTYASVQKEIYALQQAYPELICVSSIGTSVQGRDLTVMKVGKGVAKGCIVAGIHAREMITVSYTMRFVEEICAAYTSESGKFGVYDAVNLLDSYTLYIVPLSNPDGLEIISGRATPNVTITYRKDKVTGKMMDISDYKANANGVNLNKNFPLLWSQIKEQYKTPGAEGNKGSSAASEPETKALMGLCNDNDFMWMTSMHVRGDCVYWSDTTNPSVGASSALVQKLKTQCGFYVCPTSDEVDGYGGGFENWFRETFNRPGFCVELMPLDIKVTPLSNSNHTYFDTTVRWDKTYRVFPIMMIYGYIK